MDATVKTQVKLNPMSFAKRLIASGKVKLLRKIFETEASRSYQAGRPIDVPRHSINLEKNHPDRDINLAIISLKESFKPKDQYKTRNVWFSKKLNRYIYIVEEIKTNKVYLDYGNSAYKNRFNLMADTFTAASALNVNAELAALETLKDFLDRRQFSDYILTGQFIEKSKGTKGFYIIRKSKPTMYFGNNGKLITCLCMHSLGFYNGTFSGCLVPTDDVITHLQRIRSDERRYWGKANAHSPWLPTAGV